MGDCNTKHPFFLRGDGLTMAGVQRIFQLAPKPPEVKDINDYIKLAICTADFRHFAFFLHHYEQRLNSHVCHFFIREGIDQYDPERFLDYKLSCVLTMLEDLPKYDSSKNTNFLTFAHYDIGNALLECRMREEAGSFENVDEYKAVRAIAWLDNNSDKSEKEVIAEYAAEHSVSEKTATARLRVARMNRSRVPFESTIQDEDVEETGEDVTRDDSWNYAGILWNGICADAVQKAFRKLTYREQTLLENRNAICMTCGRVSPLNTRSSFEELATKFEGSTASGAERAYGKAVGKLTRKLVESGTLHSVELRRVSQSKAGKKIAVAVYEYLVDCDGEWGQNPFRFLCKICGDRIAGGLGYDEKPRFRQPRHLALTVNTGGRVAKEFAARVRVTRTGMRRSGEIEDDGRRLHIPLFLLCPDGVFTHSRSQMFACATAPQRHVARR